MLAMSIVFRQPSQADATGPAPAPSVTVDDLKPEDNLPVEYSDGNKTQNVDYSALSRMLAGVLVLREGGIANATRALPYLSAVTQHYLQTQVCIQSLGATLLTMALLHPPVMQGYAYLFGRHII
jgi:hypothetical protein